uniref:Uncharacterized protein n=1 Tax=Oryza barthii TaxID=65489 RepID=A0A0D3HQW9_9ORYZ
MRCRMIEPRRPTAMSSEWSSARFLSSWMLLLPITSLLPSMKLRLSQDKFSPVLQTNALPFQRSKSATSLQEIDT